MSGEVLALKPHGGAVVISENFEIACPDNMAVTTVFDWQTDTAAAIERSGGLVGHIKALLFYDQQTIMISCVGEPPTVSISPASEQLDLIGSMSVTIIVFAISRAAASRYLGKLKKLLTANK